MPSGGAGAAILNVTVTAPTAPGYITAFPASISNPPLASNLNFIRGQTIANLAVVRLGSGGVMLNNGSPGKTHLIVDVSGYFLS